MPTQQERIEAAFERLRKQEITPTLILDDRAIVRSECLDAYVEAADMAGTHLWAGAASEATAWHTRRWMEQGVEYSDTTLHIKSLPAFGGEPYKELLALYFIYPHLLPDTATAVVDAFRAEGFDAEWNGDRYKSVLVRLT